MSDDLKTVEVIVRPDPKNGGFVALCVDYPHCVGRAKDRARAVQHLEAAISYDPDRLRKTNLVPSRKPDAG